MPAQDHRQYCGKAAQPTKAFSSRRTAAAIGVGSLPQSSTRQPQKHGLPDLCASALDHRDHAKRLASIGKSVRCTSSAHATAATALGNSTRTPSPRIDELPLVNNDVFDIDADANSQGIGAVSSVPLGGLRPGWVANLHSGSRQEVVDRLV